MCVHLTCVHLFNVCSKNKREGLSPHSFVSVLYRFCTCCRPGLLLSATVCGCRRGPSVINRSPMCVCPHKMERLIFFFFSSRLKQDWSLMTGLSKDVSSLKSYAKAKHLIYYSVLMQQQQHRLIIK